VSQENDYINYFYDKYKGRVAIGVGYADDLSEIYPFVFEDPGGAAIGLVALGEYMVESISYVHIYHIGSFMGRRGSGTQILEELCLQADKHQVILSLSPIYMPNGNDEVMSDEHLRDWYGRYGFKGVSHFKREPQKI
jgi:hypothetical protein